MSDTTLGRYLKPAGRTTTPRRVLSVVTVGTPCHCGSTTDTHSVQVLDRVVCSWSTRGRSGWAPVQSVVYTEGQDFLDWLESERWGRAPLYIVAPCASASLTLIRFWDRLEHVGAVWFQSSTKNADDAGQSYASGAYKCSTPVLSRVPDIVQYRRWGRQCTWVSLPQLLPLTTQQLVMMSGYAPTSPLTLGGVIDTDPLSPHDESMLGLNSMMRLIDWWRKIDGGPWAHTVAGLAFKHWMKMIGVKEVCTHNNPDVLSLERSACYGGRTSCWYVGSVGGPCVTMPRYDNAPTRASISDLTGPVYRVDLRSAYPSLLLDRVYPTLLLASLRKTEPAAVRDAAESTCVIVQCTVQSETGEYPSRCTGELCYPVGTFATTLTGPEYVRAYDAGEILATGRASVYRTGRPFRRCYSTLLSMRDDARRAENQATDTMLKCLSNSLTGRLAMRRRSWRASEWPGEDRAGDPRAQVRHGTDSSTAAATRTGWGDWIDSRPDYGWNPSTDERVTRYGLDPESCRPRIVRRFRSIAGMVMELHESDVGEGTLQACYAYLMAYCRVVMRDIRSMCPTRSVLVQDTDGLWLTQSGYDALRSHTHLWGDSPGKLRLVSTIDRAVIYGPQHYWVDGEWTLSGLHQPIPTGDPLVWTDSYTVSPIQYGATSAPDRIVTVRRTVDLRSLLRRYKTDATGWVLPLRLPLSRCRVSAVPQPEFPLPSPPSLF